MSTTLLRKLTERSVLKFGRYPDFTIKDLLIQNRHHYLRWVYFHAEAITFTDELLKAIGLGESDRIEKPGKNPLAFIEIDRRYKKDKSHKAPSTNRIKREITGLTRFMIEGGRNRCLKLKLQARNQGH